MNGGTTGITVDRKLADNGNYLSAIDLHRLLECVCYRIHDLESKQRHRVDQSREKELVKLCELKTRLERAL
jgi:hypothetical protein